MRNDLEPLTGVAAEQHMRRLTRRGFAVGALAALAGAGAWGWLQSRATEDGLPWPLRRVLDFNRSLAEGYFSEGRLAPTFPADAVPGSARTNGLVGLAANNASANWKVVVEHPETAGQVVPLATILALPRQQIVNELKCVEGWSQVIQWSGVRFADFAAKFGPRQPTRYVYLATPDGSYYVGLDWASAVQPQSLLADIVNGAPLTWDHGAPLRVLLTVKYGYKSLKRVGLVRFTNERPPCYWAQRSYDWYAGL